VTIKNHIRKNQTGFLMLCIEKLSKATREAVFAPPYHFGEGIGRKGYKTITAFEKDHPYWLDLSNKLEEVLSKRGLNWRNQLKRPAPRTPWQAQNRSAPADTSPK
jgi:hypothetical protein